MNIKNYNDPAKAAEHEKTYGYFAKAAVRKRTYGISARAAAILLAGEIVVDSISSLDLILNASQYTGAINSSGTAGTVAVSLDETSTWTLTGDSYITSFEGDLSNVNTNSYTLYVNGTAVN